jgi:hypothetical protein
MERYASCITSEPARCLNIPRLTSDVPNRTLSLSLCAMGLHRFTRFPVIQHGIALHATPRCTNLRARHSSTLLLVRHSYFGGSLRLLDRRRVVSSLHFDPSSKVSYNATNYFAILSISGKPEIWASGMSTSLMTYYETTGKDELGWTLETNNLNEPRVRCTEFDENGNVALVDKEYRKSELVTKARWP